MSELWNNLTKPFDFEENYLSWRRNSINEITNIVGDCLKERNKSLKDIKQDIKYCVKGGMLRPKEEHLLSLTSIPPQQFFKEYVEAWEEHDRFIFNNKTSLIKGDSPEFLEKLIKNDKNIMAYTLSMNSPFENLANRIYLISGGNLPYIPLNIFDHNLFEFSRYNKLSLEQIMNSYYENDILSKEGGLLDTKSVSLMNLSDIRYFKEFESENKNHLQSLTLFLRMTFWTNYEEPKRRFFAEFGIVDYLYREKLFNSRKNEFIEKGKNILTIKPEDFQI